MKNGNRLTTLNILELFMLERGTSGKELEVRLDLVTKELNSLKLNATNVVVDEIK